MKYFAGKMILKNVQSTKQTVPIPISNVPFVYNKEQWPLNAESQEFAIGLVSVAIVQVRMLDSKAFTAF